jgi:hypothetical protein
VTSPEDRLRQILLAEAEDIVPAGDGLQRIEQRLADRHSLRSKLIPAVAIAGVVGIAAAAAITVSLTDQDSLKQRTPPAHGGGTPSPAPTTVPTPTAPTTGVTTSASGTPVWPFTTDTQAADWKSSRPWAGDPVQVTQHLLDDYLKLPGHATTRVNDDAAAAIVEVSIGTRPVAQVRLVRVGRDTDRPWSVTGATSDNLSVTKPADGADVSSPIAISGRASDPDTSVHLRLMTERVLGEGYAMAGRELPWTHTLPWTGTDWSVAALVANTFSGKGDLSAITITAVRRAGAATVAPPPSPGTTFVAVDKGHVVTVDALTGKQLRQVSFLTGVVDSEPDRGGADGVVWVRTPAEGCRSSLIRVDRVGAPASVPVAEKAVRRTLPALSEGGRSLAWVERPCSGGVSTVAVRGPDGKAVTNAISTSPVEELDVRDDGWAVVQAGGHLRVLPPGTDDVSRVPFFTSRRDCVLVAPAWDGDAVLAWQGCPGNTWSLDRWSVTTGTATQGPAMSGLPEPRHTAVAAGQVLVWLTGGRVTRVSGQQLIDVPNATRWEQPDW